MKHNDVDILVIDVLFANRRHYYRVCPLYSLNRFAYCMCVFAGTRRSPFGDSVQHREVVHELAFPHRTFIDLCKRRHARIDDSSWIEYIQGSQWFGRLYL